MAGHETEILILGHRIEPSKLSRLTGMYFEDMVKYVVDVRRKVVAIGGELHADAEQLLLRDGSQQEDLWGANYYPGQGEAGCIEYTALINIRPGAGNRSMEIGDEQLREKVRKITFELIGRGEEVG